MTETKIPDPERQTPDEIRQGVKSNRVSRVLGVSLALAVIALAVVFITVR